MQRLKDLQQVMGPGSVGRFQGLDDEPDGRVVLHLLRVLSEMLKPAEFEGWAGVVTLRRAQSGGGRR